MQTKVLKSLNVRKLFSILFKLFPRVLQLQQRLHVVVNYNMHFNSTIKIQRYMSILLHNKNQRSIQLNACFLSIFQLQNSSLLTVNLEGKRQTIGNLNRK